jgi:hypothetical protein
MQMRGQGVDVDSRRSAPVRIAGPENRFSMRGKKMSTTRRRADHLSGLKDYLSGTTPCDICESSSAGQPGGKNPRPEAEVVARIDELWAEQDKLINASLKRGQRGKYHWGYEWDGIRFEECPKCHHDFHGLPCLYYECTCGHDTPQALTTYVDQIESVSIHDGNALIALNNGWVIDALAFIHQLEPMRQQLLHMIENLCNTLGMNMRSVTELMEGLQRMLGSADYAQALDVLAEYSTVPGYEHDNPFAGSGLEMTAQTWLPGDCATCDGGGCGDCRD